MEKGNLQKIQMRLLEMGMEIARVLESHNIPHMITFGTLLGAVRHGGFIPWDDDFDFFLFDDTYEEALSYLRKELPNDMFLEDSVSEPLYFHGWAHVKDVNSIANCKQFPQDNSYSHKGISVDLYRAKSLQERDLEKFLLDEHIAYLKRKMAAGLITEEDMNLKKDALIRKYEALTPSESTKDVFGMALAERSMDADAVLPLKKYKFNDVEFLGPNNYDTILKGFYGDYMTLPPEDHRKPHYDHIVFLR